MRLIRDNVERIVTSEADKLRLEAMGFKPVVSEEEQKAEEAKPAKRTRKKKTEV